MQGGPSRAIIGDLDRSGRGQAVLLAGAQALRVAGLQGVGERRLLNPEAADRPPGLGCGRSAGAAQRRAGDSRAALGAVLPTPMAFNDVQIKQKALQVYDLPGFFRCSGGQGGIRTRVGILSQTRFPGVRLKPLIHLSGEARHYSRKGRD